MMFRTPSAWAPSSSDSMAIRLRSRVVKWTRHSRSRSCWIPNATAIALIRTRAIAQSLDVDEVDPGSRRSRAASMVRSILMLRGGSISTEMAKRPAVISSASRVGLRRAVSVSRRPRCDRRPRPGRLEAAARDARRTARSVVRTRRTPRASRRRDRASSRSNPDDPRARGEHGGGHGTEVIGAGRVDELTLEPLRQTGVRHDRPRGLTPRPQSPSRRARRAMRPARAAVDPDGVGAGRGQRRDSHLRVLPSTRTSSSPNVNEAITGRSLAARASSIASMSSSRSQKVSRTITSTPPSSRPSICSRNAARTSASATSGPSAGRANRAVRPNRR